MTELHPVRFKWKTKCPKGSQLVNNFNSSVKYLYLQVNISLVCMLKLIRFAERYIDHCICNMNFGLNTSLYTKHTAMNWMDVAIHVLGYNNILKTKNSVKRYRRMFIL